MEVVLYAIVDVELERQGATHDLVAGALKTPRSMSERAQLPSM
jgi:hypothetical protein